MTVRAGQRPPHPPSTRRGAEAREGFAGPAESDHVPTGGEPPTLHAWVDESMRHDAAGNGLYLLAAAVGDPARCSGIRQDLRNLLYKRQERMHWRDESDPRRSKIAAAVGQLDLASVVVVAAPLDAKKQERARRQCMEVLYSDLCTRGVGTIWQEARTPSLNTHDRKMIAALRGKRLLPAHVRVEFAMPTQEPMLWVPDAVAGAVGCARVGDGGHWLEQLEGTVTQIDIELR